MNRKAIVLFVGLGLLLGGLGDRFLLSRAVSPHATVSTSGLEDKFAAGVSGVGFYRDGPLHRVVLSDGRTVVADAFRETSTGWQAKVGDLWYRGER